MDLMTCLEATPRRMLLQLCFRQATQRLEPQVFQATWRYSGVDLDLEADIQTNLPETLQCPGLVLPTAFYRYTRLADDTG